MPKQPNDEMTKSNKNDWPGSQPVEIEFNVVARLKFKD
jgi:hypothetical protein